jgi:predicted enzyme related to lactoylglutathione lyase
MPNPVVHFEVIGKDGAVLQRFFGELFGWEVDARNPMQYGIVEAQGAGIGGGIGSNPEGGGGYATFYVQVEDPQAYLDKAERLGGKTLVPVTEIPDMVTFALFADPEGHVVGLVKG